MPINTNDPSRKSWLDVPDNSDFPIQNIPFSEIEKHQNQLVKSQNIVLFCQSGIRSKKAVELLVNNGFTNIYHLQNGIQSLHLETTT